MLFSELLEYSPISQSHPQRLTTMDPGAFRHSWVFFLFFSFSSPFSTFFYGSSEHQLTCHVTSRLDSSPVLVWGSLSISAVKVPFVISVFVSFLCSFSSPLFYHLMEAVSTLTCHVNRLDSSPGRVRGPLAYPPSNCSCCGTCWESFLTIRRWGMKTNGIGTWVESTSQETHRYAFQGFCSKKSQIFPL